MTRKLSLVQLPVSYDEEAKSKEFLTFLDEVLYPEDVPVVSILPKDVYAKRSQKILDMILSCRLDGFNYP